MKKLIFVLIFSSTLLSQQIFKSTEYGVEMTFPDGWTVEKGTLSMVVLIARLNATTSINIVVQENAEWKDYTVDKIEPEKFRVNLEKKYSAYFTNFRTLDYGKVKVSAYEALYYSYNCDINNETIRANQYFLIKDDKMYVISSGCLDSEYLNFFEVLFNETINTFRFTG